jgi:transcriptional regulator of NAD metabolism
LLQENIRHTMNIRTRRDVKKFLEELSTRSSSLLKNVTGGYHYHTIEAESEEILDDIQNGLAEKGFLARLQDYEPVDFWGEEESNTNV